MPVAERQVRARRRYSRSELSKAERLELLMTESRACAIDDRIVDWAASLWTTAHAAARRHGGRCRGGQEFHYVVPGLHVTANDRGLSQTRSWGGRYNGFCQQGRASRCSSAGVLGRRAQDGGTGARAARRAELSDGDVRRRPDAGPDDAADPRVDRPPHRARPHPGRRAQLRRNELRHAGHVRLVSVRLAAPQRHVRSDARRAVRDASRSTTTAPARSETTSSATGSSCKPLGGTVSQARSGMPGVATTRACSWNRPPIDRMSNLNVEAGHRRASTT